MPKQQLEVAISQAQKSDLAGIKKHIAEFRLDDEGLEPSQFLLAKYRNELVGFGRIREYENCSELCSLGVIEPERNKGVGSLLTNHLIKKAKQELYLVCIIPDFFIPHHFTVTKTYPAALADKLFRCETSLAVPEKYVVMKLN
ncbi:MAG: GNAT family N-acetyltransferase [Bacteroidia bacterium]